MGRSGNGEETTLKAHPSIRALPSLAQGSASRGWKGAFPKKLNSEVQLWGLSLGGLLWQRGWTSEVPSQPLPLCDSGGCVETEGGEEAAQGV